MGVVESHVLEMMRNATPLHLIVKTGGHFTIVRKEQQPAVKALAVSQVTPAVGKECAQHPVKNAVKDTLLEE